jgi:ABC-type phosphate transport system substrate-binding protein
VSLRRWPGLLLIGVIVMMALPSRAQAQFLVVVNAANPVTAVSRSQLADMLLGRSTRWSHGVPVAASDLPVTSRVRQAFSKLILGQSAAAVRSFWQQQQFSGRGQAPTQFATDDDVLAYVRQTPGGVGYITMTTPLQPGTRALVVLP